MTDETREQIEKHAIHYANHQTHGNGNYFAIVKHFESGATHQHPISYEAGRKTGRDEIIDAIEKLANTGLLYNDVELPCGEERGKTEAWKLLLKELEAMKTGKA